MARTTRKRKPRAKQRGDRAKGSSLKRLFKIGLPVVVICAGALLFFMLDPFPKSTFDEARAFEHLLAQYGFGPRLPGTEPHRRCLEYITQELDRYLPGVRHHNFTYESVFLGRVQGTNVWASSGPEKRASTGRVLLCAHWDTRPMADMDPDPANRSRGVPGANDVASGVAVLLEVARILGRKPPPGQVDIVLFDMEDMGGLPPAQHRQDPFCIGSSRFVAEHPEFRPDFGILLDMVGKRGLRIPKEAISLERAPQIVERVWAVARRLGIKAFSEKQGPAVLDDHVPFLEKGIAVIDLIDMDYPAWHTLQDTPERCSPESLKQVGEVVLGVIYGK